MFQRKRGVGVLAVVGVVAMGGLLGAPGASAASFTECPAIGADQGCEVLLQVNAGGAITVQDNPSAGPFDGSDDTLVGIVNDSKTTLDAVTVTGPGSGLSKFDGDGICSGAYGTWAGSSGCPYGPTGYEGPGTAFVISAAKPDSAEIDFSKGLAPGASAYFSLEGTLASAQVNAREGTLDSFTVNGSLTNLDRGTQDTHATEPTSSCNPARRLAYRGIAYAGAKLTRKEGGPTAADLLEHFLGNSGIKVTYGPSSLPAMEVLKDPEFTALNKAVVAAVVSQLNAGNTAINLTGNPVLQTITLGDGDKFHFHSGGFDLYWAFRGTQYLTVSGTGSVANGVYSGTITYTIGDNFGLPTGSNLLFGPEMRYLQINCGDDGGAHYFKDFITVSQKFSEAAGS